MNNQVAAGLSGHLVVQPPGWRTTTTITGTRIRMSAPTYAVKITQPGPAIRAKKDAQNERAGT